MGFDRRSERYAHHLGPGLFVIESTAAYGFRESQSLEQTQSDSNPDADRLSGIVRISCQRAEGEWNDNRGAVFLGSALNNQSECSLVDAFVSGRRANH